MPANENRHEKIVDGLLEKMRHFERDLAIQVRGGDRPAFTVEPNDEDLRDPIFIDQVRQGLLAAGDADGLSTLYSRVARIHGVEWVDPRKELESPPRGAALGMGGTMAAPAQMPAPNGAGGGY